jgi:hypothetical protein
VIFFAILGRTLLIYRDQISSWFSSSSSLQSINQFQAPGDILPVFIYDATDTNSPVKPHGGRVWLVYGLLSLAFIWGVLEVFFVSGSSFAIGIGVACASIVIFTWYTFEGTTSSLIEFHKAVAYLEEGSNRYIDTMKQIKAGIERGFFTRMAEKGVISEMELRATRGTRRGKVIRAADGTSTEHKAAPVTDVSFCLLYDDHAATLTLAV